MKTRRVKTRREFLKISVLAGASAGAGLLAWRNQGFIKRAWADNDLNPTLIPKYMSPLPIPATMPKTSTAGGIDYYEIAVRQFTQQILPSGYPSTRVWGYGSVNPLSTFSYPARTIEAQYNKTVRVKWINGLVNSTNRFRPHLLDVEQDLHWANPPGGIAGRDSRGTSTADYLGPVPIITHVHGAHDNEESDGFPEAWYLPAANNIPAGYAGGGGH